MSGFARLRKVFGWLREDAFYLWLLRGGALILGIGGLIGVGDTMLTNIINLPSRGLMALVEAIFLSLLVLCFLVFPSLLFAYDPHSFSDTKPSKHSPWR